MRGPKAQRSPECGKLLGLLLSVLFLDPVGQETSPEKWPVLATGSGTSHRHGLEMPRTKRRAAQATHVNTRAGSCPR